MYEQQERELLRLFKLTDDPEDRLFVLATAKRGAARALKRKPLLRIVTGQANLITGDNFGSIVSRTKNLIST